MTAADAPHIDDGYWQLNEEIRHYLMILKRRWLLLVLSFVAVLTAGIVVALTLPPVYRSSAVILVESQQIPDELVRSTVTSLPDERIRIIEQRIMTRDNVLRIIRKFDLYKDKSSRLSNSELVDLMRSGTAIVPISFGNLRRNDNLSIAFTISFEHESPSTAVQVANELVTLILDENVRSRTQRAAETAKFLKREVERRRQELNAMEAQIAEYKQANREALPDNLALRMNTLDRAEDQLSEIKGRIRVIEEERKLYLLGFSTDSTGAIGSAGIAGQNLVSQRYEQLQAELIRKSATYSDNHPEIKFLKREIASVEAEMGRLVGETPEQGDSDGAVDDPAQSEPKASTAHELRLAAYQQRIDLLQSEQERLEERIGVLTDSISQTPQVELGLRSLTRNYESVRQQHQELLAKLADAELGETLEEDKQAERFEIIEQPTQPSEPVKPNRPKIAVFGFLMAMAASGGSLIALESIDVSVRSPSHLAGALNRRPIVSVPYIRTRREKLRNRHLIFLLLAAMVIGGLIFVVLVHLFYMPLDLLVIKLRSYLPI